MATHSRILAWEIPWTEEPGGLQSMGSEELDTPSLLANAGFRRGPLGAEQLGVGVNQTRRFIPGN